MTDNTLFFTCGAVFIGFLCLMPTPTKNFVMRGLNQAFVCVKCAKIFLEDYEGYRPH